MSVATTKRIPQPQRAVALAALATAQRQHEHTAIRPKRARGQDRRSEAVEVPRGTMLGKHFDSAMDSAGAAWPNDDNWEVIGSDDYADPCDNDELAGDDTSMFDDPTVYGEFDSMPNPDLPGWEV